MEDNFQGLADYQLTTPMDNVDTTRNLLEVMSESGTQAPLYFAELRGQLPQPQATLLDSILDVASRRASAYLIEDPTQRAATLKAMEADRDGLRE